MRSEAVELREEVQQEQVQQGKPILSVRDLHTWF